METPIPGLTIYRDAIEEEIQGIFLKDIESREWSTELTRKVQHYYYIYDYTLREPKTRVLTKTVAPPPSLVTLGECMYKSGVLKDKPNQVIVNKYQPGEGIGKHRDHAGIFGDSIGIVSLGSPVVMEFEGYGPVKRTQGPDYAAFKLNPGDMITMEGDARMWYSHEIKKRKTDIDPETQKRFARGTRISITYRRVKELFCE